MEREEVGGSDSEKFTPFKYFSFTYSVSPNKKFKLKFFDGYIQTL